MATILGNLNSGQPISDPNVVLGFIVNITNFFLGVAGIAALAMIVYAGFTMVTSVGNPERVASAKKILTAAIVGLLIILGSAAILNFVVQIPGGKIQ